jgi:RNA polymerase sigma factor (sigma-70 family)
MIIRFAKKNKKIQEMPAIISETPLDVLINRQQLKYKEILLKNLPKWLNELDPREKIIVKMKYFEGHKIIQISRLLNLTKYEINKSLTSAIIFFKAKVRELCE